MTDNSIQELAQQTALAERLADEGQMNLNKLVEAAVYAAIRRAGWVRRPRISKGMMQAELAHAIHALKLNGLSPELVAALEIGLNALYSARGGDMLIDEAPDAFVCRTCGHISLGSPPDRCPDCAAFPGRFRKFVAFFNRDNIDPLQPGAVLNLLAQNANTLARLVFGLSEETMNRQPAEDVWSIRDHISHFYDTQVMLDTRLDLMLNHDNPDLAALAVYEFATETGRHPAAASDILGAFCQKRESCVSHLQKRPLSDMYRTGTHPEFGQLTVLRQVAYIAAHEQVHLPEIEALCARMGADP